MGTPWIDRDVMKQRDAILGNGSIALGASHLLARADLASIIILSLLGRVGEIR